MKPIIIPITLICLLFSFQCHGQEIEKNNYFPLWTFHDDSVNIHGISLGLWTINGSPKFTNTNGVKYELIGLGLFIPLMGSSPIVSSDSAFIMLSADPLSEIINGLNLSSSGTACHCLTNGISAGAIAQINFQVNGISASIIANLNQKHNGMMVAMANETYTMNGLQIGLIGNNSNLLNGLQVGLFNKTKHLKGIQIGLWNVNQKRKLPLVNWNFKRDKL